MPVRSWRAPQKWEYPGVWGPAGDMGAGGGYACGTKTENYSGCSSPAQVRCREDMHPLRRQVPKGMAPLHCSAPRAVIHAKETKAAALRYTMKRQPTGKCCRSPATRRRLTINYRRLSPHRRRLNDSWHQKPP